MKSDMGFSRSEETRLSLCRICAGRVMTLRFASDKKVKIDFLSKINNYFNLGIMALSYCRENSFRIPSDFHNGFLALFLPKIKDARLLITY